MVTDLELLVQQARSGDRAALETLVSAIQDRIYNFALRMLWHPADAEDAAQEILIQIVTNLGGFRGESAFLTWCYRIAANHLRKTRKRRAEREEISFERFGEQLAEGLSDRVHAAAGDEALENLLAEEVKIGCTQGMLLCLDRNHRLAYILGAVFEVTSEEGADILGITPPAFRKRLSRARQRIHGFMERHCGLVNPERPCRCSRRIDSAVGLGRVDPRNLLFAGRPVSPAERTLRQGVSDMESLHTAAQLFRSHPTFAAPERFRRLLSVVTEARHLTILQEEEKGRD